MDDSSGKLNRRAFLYGAGGLTVASVLAGCGGGSSGNNSSSGDNETAGGTTTESETATEAATESETATETGTETETATETGTEAGTETETENETELTDTETTAGNGTDTETGNGTGTEAETTAAGTDTETTAGNGTAASDTDAADDGEDRSEHRLTFGEIRQQPPSEMDSLNQEYVELINASGSTIDLSGYTITYGDGAKYTFDDGFKLPVDQPVTVHTGSGDDSDTDVYVGRDEVALNYKGPDKVTVTNADGTVVLEATV